MRTKNLSWNLRFHVLSLKRFRFCALDGAAPFETFWYCSFGPPAVHAKVVAAWQQRHQQVDGTAAAVAGRAGGAAGAANDGQRLRLAKDGLGHRRAGWRPRRACHGVRFRRRRQSAAALEGETGTFAKTVRMPIVGTAAACLKGKVWRGPACIVADVA